NEVQLEWKGSGRWGLNLDLTSRSNNLLLPREELSARAFYQVTPRFRFGGGLSFQSDGIGDTSNWSQDDMEAGVHIESAFSF
ncbi:MAG: NtrZ family periplasmic regulatory protein, partial [Pseudomonadota bacterium]